MNRTFLSALRANGGPGTPIRTASGTIPARVNPPSDPQGSGATGFAIFSPAVKPVKVQVASAAPSSSSITTFFGNLFGSKSDNSGSNGRESPASQPAQTKASATTGPNAARATKTTAVPADASAEAQRAADTKPRGVQQGGSGAPPDAPAARTTPLLTGAVPAMAAGSFQTQTAASR
jgi:hypothetical protein